MTPKDKQIQEQRQRIVQLEAENAGLREELSEIVEAIKICRHCKNLKNACIPGGKVCKPEWRGEK